MSDNIVIIHTDNMTAPEVGNGLWGNRASVYENVRDKNAPLVSIMVLAYNRLEKTKYCVECILKYTKNIDYELILVDNGSTDNTLEFFKSIKYNKKKILHVTTNIGSAYAFGVVMKIYSGKYMIPVSNDVYVTYNWLENLLACYESDQKIGLVVPMSSNTSNLQAPEDFDYESMENMQKKAAEFNTADSSKWQERMRLITVLAVYKREVFDEVGLFDRGFGHNFMDDDISIRIRRAGYKLIVCGDTVVCHDHQYLMQDQAEVDKFNYALEEDRCSFKEKYHGIDAWDDFNNFETNLLQYIEPEKYRKWNEISILGIDVRCGTPILEMKNVLRKAKLNLAVDSFAFTTQAKYYEDLLTVADEVYCDRTDFIQDYIPNHSMDIILLGEPINNYHEPIRFLQKIFDLLTDKGVLLFKVKNIDGFSSFLRMIGINVPSDGEMSAQIFPDEIAECCKLFGAENIKCIKEVSPLSDEKINILNQIVKFNSDSQQFKTMKERCEINQYLFCLEK